MASLEEPVAPTFTSPLMPSREVMEGARVRLDCVLVGNPEPEVSSYRCRFESGLVIFFAVKNLAPTISVSYSNIVKEYVLILTCRNKHNNCITKIDN